MFEWIRRSYGRIFLDTDEGENERKVKEAVSLLSLSEARSLFYQRWGELVTAANVPNNLDEIRNGLPDELIELFCSFDEIDLGFANLGFVGHPTWIPGSVPDNYQIIGYIAENEFIWAIGQENRVVIYDLHDDSSILAADEYASVFHAIILLDRVVSGN